METIVINGMSYEVVERDGKRYIKKPAGGAGGGVTGYVLECIGDVSAPSPEPAALPSISVPQADALAIEQAVEKAVADSTPHAN